METWTSLTTGQWLYLVALLVVIIIVFYNQFKNLSFPDLEDEENNNIEPNTTTTDISNTIIEHTTIKKDNEK